MIATFWGYQILADLGPVRGSMAARRLLVRTATGQIVVVTTDGRFQI
jgi:hypothetical protein